MENHCHRCNAEVSTGTPFCPQCGAPQIRVAMPTPPQVQPSDAAQRTISGSFDSVNPPSSIKWSSALSKAAVSGFATVALLRLLSAVTQLPPLFFLLLPLGGAFAVLLYVRAQEKRVSASAGARLGAVTGFFSFVVFALMAAAEFTSQRSEVMSAMRKALQDAAAKNPDPQAQAIVQQMMTPTGIATLFTLAAIIFLLVFLMLGSLGGILGAALFKNPGDRQD